MINIANILRKWEYCDIVLDSPYGKVVYDFVDDDECLIFCHLLENDENAHFDIVEFDFLGRVPGTGGDCDLLPEGKTNWDEQEFSVFREGDILSVRADGYEFVIEYAGVDKDRMVKTSAFWDKDLGFRGEGGVLCSLDEVSDVRPASNAEEALLRLYMERYEK